MYTVLEDTHYWKVSVPQYFWYGRTPLELTFPKHWNIRILEMAGDRLPVLSTKEIREKLFHPVGTGTLSQLAAGKKEVAIVVDDMSRPTEASLIVPHILQSLSDAGILDENVRFLIALGCHGANTREDFSKKIGEDILQRFGVYNHNCYENCVEVGPTSSGLSLQINEELMKCDLKIGIGAILPHLYTGYSGGGKLFLPGMAHIDTVNRFHSSLHPTEKGKFNTDNPMIREMTEATKLIGVDFLINVLLNSKGQFIDLFAGSPTPVYLAGVEKAASIYVSEITDLPDIIVSNAHLKANEGDIALLAGLEGVRHDRGTCVLVLNSPGGQMTHYLMRRFGKYIGGRQSDARVSLPDGIEVMVFSQYIDTTTFDPYENKERIRWEKQWDHIIKKLTNRHGDADVSLGIIPDGTIQYIQGSIGSPDSQECDTK